MLTRHHTRLARLAGLGCAALIAAGGLTLAPKLHAQEPAAQDGEKKEVVKRIEIREMDGKKDVLVRGESGDMHKIIADCSGEKVEVGSEGTTGERKERIKMVLCAKDGESLVPALEKALVRIEQQEDLPADRKAEIVTKLRAKIAELKSRG